MLCPQGMDLVPPGCGSWAPGEDPVWVNYSPPCSAGSGGGWGRAGDESELVWVLQGEQCQEKGPHSTVGAANRLCRGLDGALGVTQLPPGLSPAHPAGNESGFKEGKKC